MERAAAAIVFRGAEVLLVRRGRPPLRGSWSLPGGRIEPGEPAERAALRELHEETGLVAATATLLTTVHVGAFEVHECMIHGATGEPVAADDADAVTWAGPEDEVRLGLTPALRAVLALARDSIEKARKAP